MKKIFGVATIVLLFCSFAFAEESGLLDKNAGIITKPSNLAVIETMDRVEAAAKAGFKGIGIWHPSLLGSTISKCQRR